MNYEELVKALRCVELRLSCNECEYGTWSESGEAWVCEFERRDADAAAAIEELQAGVKRLNMRCADCEYASKPWPELEPKRGEWELIDGAEPMRWGCSRCKYMSWETSTYCPRCGAKMEVQE